MVRGIMQTVKLSVTVKRRLERKYDRAAVVKINRAVGDWIAADAKRGIRTVHVAVDDGPAMRALGANPITGNPTAAKVKRAVDELWMQLNPDYLAILGSEDIVPMFHVPNPSYDPGGDDDRKVPTDNPYASSSPFRASKRSSYLVPDRVIGRIPDMVSDGDPSWFVDYLATAASWVSQPASVYAGAYAICCDEWRGAGEASTRYIGEPASQLLISPPISDDTGASSQRLGARLHMIKCHGAQLDPKFYGQQDRRYPVALTSETLKSRLNRSTIAAAMCCYGAQVYSPADPAATDPGKWPLASTYLRKGAYGFVGSTMIAWVGVPQMMCADWIVAGYLKGLLGGASQGRALLESKQDYVRWITQQGHAPDIADEKTLIEYVLLGDPSIHPVSAAPAIARRMVRAARALPILALAAQERRQRRVVRALMAGQIRDLLPSRAAASRSAQAHAQKVFAAAKAGLEKSVREGFKAFGIRPASFRVERLNTPLPSLVPARPGLGPAKPSAVERRQSLEYYWTGRRMCDGHKQVRLVKAETDARGNLLRTSVVHSS